MENKLLVVFNPGKLNLLHLTVRMTMATDVKMDGCKLHL